MHVIRHLLWVDCIAAALAGTLLLTFDEPLSALHALPSSWLRLIGAINLFYACISGSLASRKRRPMTLIAALSIANGTWAITCIGTALAVAGTATAFGMAQLLGEATFVGGLGWLEWRWREQLAKA